MNYDLLMRQQIESLGGIRPRLLLHSCCAPCSIPALERLLEHFELTVFFYNPNIETHVELEKRLNELRRLLAPFVHDLSLIVPEYDHGEFLAAVSGFEREPEGGERCRRCFALRFERAARAAAQEDCDYVASTITTGPRKDAETVNTIGGLASQDIAANWLPADFKKRGGYQRSVARSKELGMYRQDFCGCEFSRRGEGEIK